VPAGIIGNLIVFQTGSVRLVSAEQRVLSSGNLIVFQTQFGQVGGPDSGIIGNLIVAKTQRCQVVSAESPVMLI